MLSVEKFLALLLRKQTFYQVFPLFKSLTVKHVPCVDKLTWNKSLKKFLMRSFSHSVHYTHLNYVQNASEISLRIKCRSNFRTNFRRPKANIRKKFRKAPRNFGRTFFEAKRNFAKFRINRNNRLSIFRRKFFEISFETKFRSFSSKSPEIREFRRISFALLLHNTVWGRKRHFMWDFA